MIGVGAKAAGMKHHRVNAQTIIGFVRIATEDGKTLIVAKADSGRPRVPTISDADL